MTENDETVANQVLPKMQWYKIRFPDGKRKVPGAPLSSFLNVKFTEQLYLETVLANLLKYIYFRNEKWEHYSNFNFDNAFAIAHPQDGLVIKFQTHIVSGKLSMDTIFEKFLTFLKELKSEWTVYNWKIVSIFEEAVSRKDKNITDLSKVLLEFGHAYLENLYATICVHQPFKIFRKALGCEPIPETTKAADLSHETIVRQKLEWYTVVFNDKEVDLVGAPLSSFLNVKFATEKELKLILADLLKSIYARNENCGNNYEEMKLGNAYGMVHPVYGLVISFHTNLVKGKLSIDTIFERFLTFLKELESKWTVYKWKIVPIFEKAVSKKDKKKTDLDAVLLQFGCPEPIPFPRHRAQYILFKALGYTVFLY
ncbi:hypothetical protein MHBO_002923 [Bonamia ostreae]|uniref:Uncharacterized protein n=1 Tax=Bonamia ostreae TaxID=126728 RepID=A0ABV2ANZ9_9EUKA